MRRFPLRRLLGALLSLAIVAGAPGSSAYQAAAQTAAGRAAGTASSARAVPVLGLSDLSSPVPSLSASALSVSPALSSPAAAPEVRAAAALAIPARAAAASAAVPMGPVRVVPAQAPLTNAAKTGPPAVFAPSALVRDLSAAAVPEKVVDAARLFDGASAKAVAGGSVPAPRGGFGRAVKKGLAILALSIGLLGAQHQAAAQTAPLPQPAPHGRIAQGLADSTARQAAKQKLQALAAQAQAAPAQAAPAPAPAPAADTARVVLPRPLEAQASVDRQGVTVGERIHLTITLRNTSDKPVTLHNLRSSLQEAVPADLELQGKGAEAPLTLAPGETKTVVYEAIPFGSGTLTLEGGIAVVAVGETAVYPEGIEIVLPKTEIKVATVLTPDWKQKGLRDIVGVKRANGPDWMWLAAIPLGLLLFVGVHRLVAARRLYPKLDAQRLSLVTVTETELARLKAESADLDAASFYARYQDLLTRFMVDFAGLPKAARDARTLERDLRKSFYDAGQASVAARLAAQAEAARFAGSETDAAERGRMIERLQALVASVAGKAGKPKAPGAGMLGMLALLPGAAGLTFGSPWVLLLLIPYLGYLVWSWRSRAQGARFAVSSSAQTPSKRTLRERLAGLPRVLRYAAVGLILIALARPMIGTERTETFVPSTDTMVSIDLSGSMSGDKLQGVRDAVKGYVEEQRRGTENRVGMVTFSDEAYLDVKLTTDYDALISHLKELQTTGSTAIGKSMLTAIAHFLELNALELDGKKDPRAAEVQRLLRDQGLPAALAYAKQHPDLLKTILQPERAKIVVLFTDGDSNSGIDPQAAAQIAASLGVKVYGVGIAGPNESFNEATLRGVAEKTGAKFYRAGDANAMREVLLEIARLEKSPAKIVSAVSIKDYTSLLALLAFLLIGAELTLANTRLRTLYGLAFMMALNQAPMDALNAVRTAPSAVTMTMAQAHSEAHESVTAAVPAEVIEGNRLYNQGRFAEALKKYGEAVERHPDVPEIYFNMADAYLRLGENAKADAAWAKYLSLTPDAKKQSQTLFNLANSALMAKDGEKAIELYKEALRRDATNMDAKWNLEALKQQQKEQQEQQKDSKDSKKGKPGKQKGKPGDGKPGDGKPGDGKPGDGKPGDGKPGDGKPGDGKPGDGKPQAKPGDPKEGADKLGEALGDQEKGEKDAARKGMTRKGSGVWGIGALPLAFAGQGLVFSSSLFLWVVGIGLPVLILLVAWGIKKRLDAAKRLSPGAAPKTFSSWWGARRFLGKSALALAAAGLIGLAAGDPRGGMVDERVNFGGKDIVVTVDGSHSMMYAEDGRAEKTQKELNEFITRLQGTDRVGLVVFAGKSRTASPISIDYGNFEFKINRLDVEARGIGEGSDLASGIKYAAEHFETAKKLGDRQRIMIVISDGDVTAGEISAAIAAASEHGVTVYAIGVGDPAGTKILMPTADGTGTEYLIDAKTGQPAITRLNEAPLRQLAERTGGAYFAAGGKASIDNILSEVSRLEKGQKGDLIKSPSPVGVYLLWPALLMLILDLVLPGRSLLKRGQAKDKKKGPGAAGLLGAALIPLGAWPQILPFAALATVVAAYLAADSWSGGKITRSVREWWQSRRGFVEKGVSADLIHLYDLREADERRLTAFVRGWQDAKEPLRETMIALASHDEALWREKLTAVYLSGASAETLEKVLTALRRTARLRLEPLAPIAARMGLRKAQISWMAHSDAEARLSALNAVAAGQPVAFEAPKPLAKAPGLWSRLKRGATVAVLSLMIVITGVSTVGTMNFRVEQRAAAEAAMRLFYAEDLFVFSDRYVDARITEEVIPALKRWHESPKTAGDDFERALTILRESPDPKADNILVAIFRHSGVLPLNQQAENTMLRALIERESDLLWASMDALIAQSRADAASAQMLVKLVVLGVEVGNERTFVQLFRVLKSPNKQVQQQAAGALYAQLSRNAGAKFYEGLEAAQAKHAGDPALQMWTASFAFRRLTEPGVGEADLVKAKSFLDKALVNARAIDAARLEIYKQTPPDQEVQAPPSMVAMLANLASTLQGDGGAPAALAGAARYLVAKATTDLIKDAEKVFPGLHERLVKDGVVLPDTQSSYGGGYDGYDDYHGHGGRFGGYYGGGTSTTQNYREVYKLAHLRALLAAVEELGAPAAKAPTKENFAARELLERAGMVVEQGLEAGVKAGMMEGGTAPEAAAEQLYPLLKQGDGVFTGHSFLRALREAGLAPASGDLSSQLAYPEALDAAQLTKLRELLLTIARSGSGWDSEGKARALTWSEKLYLAGALEDLDAAQRRIYPDAQPGSPIADESLALARLSRELTAGASPATAVSVSARLFARAAQGPVDAADASALLVQVFAALKGTPQEAAALDALAVALKAPNGAAFQAAALKLAVDGLHAVAEKAEAATPGLKAKLAAAGVRESESAWRPDVKLRHFRAVGEALTGEDAMTLARYAKLAALAGAPAGDTAGELAADEANVVLLAGWRLFPGSEFNEALRAAGLMPGAGNTLSDYRQTYTRAELEAVRTWLAGAAKANAGLGKEARELKLAEKVYLANALDRVDAILAARFGVAAAPVAADLLGAVSRPGQEALALARLSIELEKHKGDAAFALKAQETMFALLAARPGDAADAAGVLGSIRLAVKGTSSEEAELSALVSALKTPRAKELLESVAEDAEKTAQSLGEDAEKRFATLNKALIASGVREDDDSWRGEFKLRHYRELRAGIAAAAAKVKKPTAEQRAASERAARLLPLLEAAATASGVLSGDTPGEVSAELVNDPLQKGYQVFPGAVFNEQLRALGLMDAGSGNGPSDHRQVYTRAEIVKLRGFLSGILASGQGWESDGTTRRALTDEEKKTVEAALAAADRALAAFDAKSGKTYAFAPLALAALPALGLAPILIFTVIGLAAAYLVWKMLPAMKAEESEAAARESVPGAVIARHRRIELVARRMATAVNGGNFRSRFIGAGGTDFAEARPYQGEDMREIDWKTSAKKDELYAKKFELERDMPLMLVVDVSRSGRFGTRGTDKRAAIEDAAAVLALAAAHSNVRVGLVLVSDRVEQVIPARGGSRHAMTIVDAILKGEPTGKATDLKPGLEAAGKLLGSRAMVAVLSDFIAPDFKDALGAIASRHDVRAIRVTDPAELGPLPDVGLLPVVDAETGATRMLDTSSRAGRAEAAAAVNRREAAVEAAFAASRLTPVMISTEGDPLESLELAFHPKAKQPSQP
ncbi:MAG: VWA domain-containing protein [Elusimicrobia bacterium]|nr:VWA domain-containing protein [Elusimicrobiota bacterium]